MLRFKTPQTLGLWLHKERLSTLHGQQGLISHVEPVAYVQGKSWQFGERPKKGEKALWLFSDAEFPLAAFFRWHLERIYPLKKTTVVLVTNAQNRGISGNLWQDIFRDMPLVKVEQWQPVDILSAVHVQQQSGLLLYCEDGLAHLRVVQKGQVIESLQLGYGRYISREIRQRFHEQYGIYLALHTADSAWRKLSRPEVEQVTLEGQRQGASGSQLLLKEELHAIVLRALEPLAQEIHLLQQAYDLPCLWLMGPQQGLTGLTETLQRVFRAKIERGAASSSAFLSVFQQYLHRFRSS